MIRSAAAATKQHIHVLVVDDSAVVRQFMSSLLAEVSGMSVSVASDPYLAMEKMEKRRPDVIVLDLEMPRMDGLTFLRRIMKEDPIPVVICSGYAGRGTESALRALEEGAVEVVAKPKLGVRDFLEESAVVLLDTIRAASGARLARASLGAFEPKLTADAVLAPRYGSASLTAKQAVVAIGASTGGTEALREVLASMPGDTPGIVIVQHMPELFTNAFARRLHGLCRVAVKEAADGDRVTQGQVLIAPGDRHTMLVRDKDGYRIHVKDGPLVSRHRPSVDVLFRSVAQTAGPKAVGVLLTGMGDDGARGMVEMKRAGAATIAQDEATSVVYGMPREAVRRGVVDEVVPLARIATKILDRICS